MLRAIAGGKTEADPREPLSTLYAKYGGAVFGRCVYILRDNAKAEDAMQDVFAKALENFGGFRAEASPLTWLMQIATHHCLNVLRSERAGWRARFRREQVARGEEHGGPQVFEARDLVRRLLGRFDAETQAAAIHYHVDEMTLEEVATALGRSIPTVRKRLDVFAEALRKELAA
ncbi:MAG: sigma-70 family RNA polymerase sigma factor [Myxococcales bacterium]|nr:sigma-70 family RNA polymerase sigma factor [Myxococcales bacterium]